MSIFIESERLVLRELSESDLTAASSNSTIKLLNYEDLGDFWELHDGYYPNDKQRRVEWFNLLATTLPEFDYYGAYRNGKMVGGMALSDCKLNLRSQIIKLASVGMLRTDMLHKKEKICKDMMEYFNETSRQRGINMLTLSPFRPDFYKKMGFGYGSSLYQYQISPLNFPNTGSKECLSYLDNSDRKEYNESYNMVFELNHGMINSEMKETWFLNGLEEDGKRTLVYKENEKIRGGLIYASWNDREMVIVDMFYEEVKVLYAFCAFIHSQSDEFDRISFSTPDEHFYYLLSDPSNGKAENEYCTNVVKNMFRVINVPGLFNELSDVNFHNQNAVLEIHVNDTFCPPNNGITVVKFVDGKVAVCEFDTIDSKNHTKIKIDIADFSSLIMGAISATMLYRLGLLGIESTADLDLLDRIFTIGQKPLSVGGL